MANDTTVIFLDASPLQSSDASGLTADIIPRLSWQPSFILRSDPDVLFPVAATTLSLDDDLWRIMVASPSAMPDYSFYPIALTASFVGLNTLFWQTPALYSIVPPVGVPALQHAWRSFDLDSVRAVFNGGIAVDIQTAAPDFQGYPPSDVVAVSTGISSLGGFQFRVGTFDAVQKSAINLSVDARWLAFPRAATRSGGFYVPRMFFKGN